MTLDSGLDGVDVWCIVVVVGEVGEVGREGEGVEADAGGAAFEVNVTGTCDVCGAEDWAAVDTGDCEVTIEDADTATDGVTSAGTLIDGSTVVYNVTTTTGGRGIELEATEGICVDCWLWVWEDEPSTGDLLEGKVADLSGELDIPLGTVMVGVIVVYKVFVATLTLAGVL